MCVGTSASIRFKAASIAFITLQKFFTRSRSRVDQFDPHIVGRLKWIQVDSMSAVGGVGLKCVYSAMLHKLCS